MKLDQYQQVVRDHVVRGERHLRVNATAGSGKTHTMIESVAGCIEAGIPPHKILVTTFTRKAADEFQVRLGKRIGARAQMVRIGTFHSLARGSLRNWGIMSPGDKGWLMEDCLDIKRNKVTALKLWCSVVEYNKTGVMGLPGTKSLAIEGARWRNYDSAVGFARSQGLRHGTKKAARWVQEHIEELPDHFSDAWELYAAAKKALTCWDFQDILDAYHDALADGGCREDVVRIIVDEAQDNDPVQQAITVLWATKATVAVRCPLTLIGDARQAIYAFRGATADTFLAAQVVLKATVLDMPINYRSRGKIVRCSSAAVRGQTWSTGAEARWHRQDDDGIVREVNAADAAVLATRVLTEISNARDGGTRLEDFAILCRTNAACALYEGVAMELGIPVQVLGYSYWEARDVQDFLSYAALTQVESPKALERIYNRPKRYMRRTTMQQLARAMEDGATLIEAIEERLARTSAFMAKKTLRSLYDDIKELRGAHGWQEQRDLILTWMLRDLTDDDDGGIVGAEADNVGRRKMLELAHSYSGYFGSGLDYVRYAEAAVANVVHGDGKLKGRVVVATIHKSKGLEWPSVYVGASAGLLPHKKATDLDEELRLFYVALTRGRDEVTFAWDGEPSEFLLDNQFREAAGWLSHHANNPTFDYGFAQSIAGDLP